MNRTSSRGFTIVELLIVIVIIAILAAITIVAFNGIQNRARNAQVVSDINQVNKKILMYHAENGSYPSTGGLNVVYVDDSCTKTTVNKRADWVPGVGDIPQSTNLASTGVSTGAAGRGGCYMYASTGSSYVLSAWNARSGSPGNDTLYRRLGFRETVNYGSNLYICNHSYIGGVNGGVYSQNIDYYKASYTISNVTGCNETPPAGA